MFRTSTKGNITVVCSKQSSPKLWTFKECLHALVCEWIHKTRWNALEPSKCWKIASITISKCLRESFDPAMMFAHYVTVLVKWWLQLTVLAVFNISDRWVKWNILDGVLALKYDIYSTENEKTSLLPYNLMDDNYFNVLL